MRPYIVKRINLLEGAALFFMGFSVASGSILFGLLSLVLAIFLDALNGFLQRDKRV